MYLLHWFPMAANRLYWMLTLGGKRSTSLPLVSGKKIAVWKQVLLNPNIYPHDALHTRASITCLMHLQRLQEPKKQRGLQIENSCSLWAQVDGSRCKIEIHENRNGPAQCVNVAEHFRTRAQGVRHGETRTRIDRDRLCFCTVSHTGFIGSIGRPGGHGFLDRAQGAGGNKESDPVFHSEGLVESCGVPSDKYNYQTHSKYIKLMSISLHSHSIRWYLYDRTLAGYIFIYINPKKVAPLK